MKRTPQCKILSWIDINQLTIAELARIQREFDYFDEVEGWGSINALINARTQFVNGAYMLYGRIRSSYILYKFGLFPVNPMLTGIEPYFALRTTTSFEANISVNNTEDETIQYIELSDIPEENQDKYGSDSDKNCAFKLDCSKIDSQEKLICIIKLISKLSTDEAFKVRVGITKQRESELKQAKALLIESLRDGLERYSEPIWNSLNNRHIATLDRLDRGF